MSTSHHCTSKLNLAGLLIRASTTSRSASLVICDFRVTISTQ